MNLLMSLIFAPGKNEEDTDLSMLIWLMPGNVVRKLPLDLNIG